MPKLNDTQLVILSAAASRKSGSLLPLPKSLKMKKEAASGPLKVLLKRRLAEEHPAAEGLEPWREDESGSRLALIISEAGREAIGISPASTGQESSKEKTKAASKPAARDRKTKAPASATPQVRQGTKLAQLVTLLSRKEGCSIAEAAKATGWQAHSVRGVISGALKKKLGLVVTSDPVDGRGRVYRIAAEA